MSKSKGDTKKGQKQVQFKKGAAAETGKGLIPEKYQTPVYLALILVLILIFFKSGIFGGKVFSSADNIASASFNTYLDDAKKDGVFPLWIPYIFGGMPSFAALVPHLERMYDISHAVWVTIRDIIYSAGSNSPVWSIVLFYIIFAFSFYFLAEYKFKDKLIALYCAIAAVFITPIIQYIIVGHNSKMIAIMMFPAVFLMTEKIYDYFKASGVKRETSNAEGTERGEDSTGKEDYRFRGSDKSIFKLMLYFVGLVFFIHIQMSSNHIQMLFYLYFAIGIYLLYELIYCLIKKTDAAAMLKTLLIFGAAMGLSAVMYADSYLSIKEYNKFSIRGVPAITREASVNKEDAGSSTGTKDATSEPLDYEYATNWSFSPAEVVTLIIPYWQGFGDVEYQGQRVNTYWGQMPFTTSPVYFGVLTLLLAIMGIYYNFRRNVLVQALTVLSVTGLFLSFGRTFPVLFNLMYYHFPFYSSFRAPVMALTLVQIPMVILAAFGVKSVIEIKKDKNRTGKFTNGAKYIFPLLVLPVIFSLIGFQGYYDSMVSSSPLVQKLQTQGASPQQIQQYVSQISKVAYDNVKSEMLVIGVLLILCYGACYYYVKGKMKHQMFLGVVIILTLIDLWHIDFKTLHWDNKTEMDFKTPDYVDWILKNEKSKNYEFRVVDLSTLYTNLYAYWRLHEVNGYQGAKLREYQDMADVAGLSSPMLWKVMNVRYIISDKMIEDSSIVPVFKGSKYLYQAIDFLPRAYFVSSYKVADGLQILNNIRDGNFNPRETVFFEKEPGIKIDKPDSTAKVTITDYGIHHITLEAEASGNNLLFVSEVYYPAGWEAYIDGLETVIYKTNYLFRSIVVPKGKHKIEFKFEPEAYYMGKKITTGGNVILLLIFVTAIGGLFWKRKKNKV